jgi:hypothetical protein
MVGWNVGAEAGRWMDGWPAYLLSACERVRVCGLCHLRVESIEMRRGR